MSRLARALLVVSSIAWAENGFLRGELRDAGSGADRLKVEVSSLDRSNFSESAFVGADGSFQFRSLPMGSYQLQVRSLSGEILVHQMLTIAGPASEIVIAMPVHRNMVPEAGPTVSLSQLRRDPNGRAALEFWRGEDYLMKADLPNARKHLLKAVKADPEFAEAHVELGTTAFRAGEWEEARREFERGVELDPKQTIGWSNLASLLFQTKAYNGAEDAALHGLANAPNDPKLNFVAGASSFARGQVNVAMADRLEKATKGYANAHLLLAEVLLKLGQMKNVMMHLEAALVSTNADVRARAQFLMARIRK